MACLHIAVSHYSVKVWFMAVSLHRHFAVSLAWRAPSPLGSHTLQLPVPNDAECTSIEFFTVIRTVALINVWKAWLPAGGQGNGRCCTRTLFCCKFIDNQFHPENEELRRKRHGHCSIECEIYRLTCPFSSKSLKGPYVHDMSPYSKVCKDMQKTNQTKNASLFNKS